MNRIWLVMVFLLAPLSAVAGPSGSPAERLASIQKAQKAADAAYYKAAEALPDTPEGTTKANSLWEAYDKSQADRFLAAVNLAIADPKSDVAFDAVEWVLTVPRAHYVPAGKPAMELALEHHAANPKIGKTIALVGRFRHQQNETNATAIALIKAVAEKNPDKTARGQAFLALAWEANEKFAVAEYKKTADVDQLAADAEKKFEMVLKDYENSPRLGRENAGTLGDVARSELFDLRHLRIGKVAPDIEGSDLNDLKFKLSDYRGKVVLLVFCGDWCGPCRALYPLERSLVERLKDKPFALVGVNSDEDKDKVKKRLAEEKTTSRWFWNGPKGPDGPISRAWNVRGWPTTYVLDHKGVIRYRSIPGRDWDRAVDELLGELEKSRTKEK